MVIAWGPPIHGDDSSEASQDSFVELEKDWHLEVAKEVASTIHTRSTVKARDGLKKLTCGVFRDEWTIGHTEFAFHSLEVVTTCGRKQPAATAFQLLRQVFGEIGYMARKMKERLVTSGCGENLEYLGDFEFEEWQPALRHLPVYRCLGPGAYRFGWMLEDIRFHYWLEYDACVSKSADPYGWIPSILSAGELPSELGPVLAQFLPKPPLPPVMGVLHRLCAAYSDADHDQLWLPKVTRGSCRGESIVAWYLYDKYQQERWTISHFDDGGFDLDPEPDEWEYRDHLRDLRDIPEFQ